MCEDYCDFWNCDVEWHLRIEGNRGSQKMLTRQVFHKSGVVMVCLKWVKCDQPITYEVLFVLPYRNYGLAEPRDISTYVSAPISPTE